LNLNLDLPLLSLVIWTPIVGGVWVLFAGGERNSPTARAVALMAAVVTFLLSVPLYTQFEGNTHAMQFVERVLKDKFGKLSEYNEGLVRNGLPVVLFLRLVPVFPFNGLNFGLGLTKVTVRNYVLGTFIGIIPGTFVFVYLGSSLATLNPWHIAGAVILFLLLISHLPPLLVILV